MPPSILRSPQDCPFNPGLTTGLPRSPSDRRSSLAPPEPLKGVDSAHKPLAVGVDVELGHLIEATDIDVNLLMQAVGFDFELLREGDDFFAYDAVIEGVGFDCEPLMQGVGFEFEPRLEVEVSSGSHSRRSSVSIANRLKAASVWILSTPCVACSAIPASVRRRLRCLLLSSLFLFLHPLLVCEVQPAHLIGLLALGVAQPFLVYEPAVPDSNVGLPHLEQVLMRNHTGLRARRRGHGLKMRVEAAVFKTHSPLRQRPPEASRMNAPPPARHRSLPAAWHRSHADGFAQRLLAELYAGINQKMVGACFQFRGTSKTLVPLMFFQHHIPARRRSPRQGQNSSQDFFPVVPPQDNWKKISSCPVDHSPKFRRTCPASEPRQPADVEASIPSVPGTQLMMSHMLSPTTK